MLGPRKNDCTIWVLFMRHIKFYYKISLKQNGLYHCYYLFILTKCFFFLAINMLKLNVKEIAMDMLVELGIIAFKTTLEPLINLSL